MLLLVSKLLFERVFISEKEFLSYLPTLLHSPGVPLNRELIWHGLIGVCTMMGRSPCIQMNETPFIS